MKRTAKSIALILAVVMIIAMFPLTASAASYKPGKVKITAFKVSSVSKKTNTATVKIRWKKASKATGYWIYQRQYGGKWKCVKKLGKNYTGIDIKKVFAGQNYFKVCAVRKVGKKTYKGAFASKSKFIRSPLTYEKVLKIVGEDTEYSNGTVSVSIKGNKISIVDRLPAGSERPDDSTINAYVEEWVKAIASDRKDAKLFGGVTDVSGTVKVYLGDELIGNGQYPR